MPLYLTSIKMTIKTMFLSHSCKCAEYIFIFHTKLKDSARVFRTQASFAGITQNVKKKTGICRTEGMYHSYTIYKAVA